MMLLTTKATTAMAAAMSQNQNEGLLVTWLSLAGPAPG
jgi:hypothetical protein